MTHPRTVGGQNVTRIHIGVSVTIPNPMDRTVTAIVRGGAAQLGSLGSWWRIASTLGTVEPADEPPDQESGRYPYHRGR